MSHTRVYYVEDSAELRARICRELDQIEGIQSIGWAARAGEAITRIRLERPDVVILDLHLLEESGMDVLRELRKDEQAPTMIVLTNNSDSTLRELSLRAGARHFFDKSTEFDDLLALMAEIAGRP